jgi:hypothetical protein
MSIPDQESLLLPVLSVFADNAEHHNEEIRQLMILRFAVQPAELLQKHPDGNSVFNVKVALALANLQGAPHRGPKNIRKTKQLGDTKFYKITERGKAILSRNPSGLTLRDL